MVTRNRNLWTLVAWAITVFSGVLAQGGPQAPDNTVQVCYNNQLTFVDTGFGQLNYPLAATEQRTCSCNVALSGGSSATLRVKLTETASAASVCRSRLQVSTPQKTFRLLCSYPVNSSFDLFIDGSAQRMLFSQDSGTMQMTFSLVEGSGTVVIICTGDPLPSTTPRVPTTAIASLRPTQPTPNPATTRQKTPTTTPTPATPRIPPTSSQPTARPAPSTARTTPSTPRPNPSTSRPTPSTARPAPSTARTSPSTARPNPSTSRPTPSTARPAPSTARTTPSTPRPNPSTSRPTPSTARPAPSTARTSPSTARPNPSTSRPTPSTARPAPSTARTTPSTPRSLPSTARTTPSTSRNTPTARPTASSVRPTPSNSRLSSSTDRPTVSTAGPTPQNARQTTTSSRRTSTPGHKTTSGVQTTRRPSCPVHRDSSVELLFKSYMEELFFRVFMKCTCKNLQKEYELLKKPVFSMDQEESPPRRQQIFESPMLSMLFFARKD